MAKWQRMVAGGQLRGRSSYRRRHYENSVYWSLAISPGFRGPPAEKQVEFAVRVLDEDRRMCELQVPREVPLNPARGGWGVLVTPGDTLANTFQKCLRQWLGKEGLAL